MLSEQTQINLDDKYELKKGRIYVTGTQALVRLPIMQIQRDKELGLNTSAFISGYRGSPLGNYDRSLWNARKFLDNNNTLGHIQNKGLNQVLNNIPLGVLLAPHLKLN